MAKSSVFLKYLQANWALLLVILIAAAYSHELHYWKQMKTTIYHDAKGYYVYLPALIIEGDITMQFVRGNDEVQKKYSALPVKGSRNTYTKYTMGVAILDLPFFLMAHAYALATDVEADGFSLPYRFGITCAAFFYFIIGFIFLSKTLKKYFDPTPANISLLIIGLGTNLYHYATVQPTMSHIYSFSMVSIFVFFATEWWQNKTWKNAIIIGLSAGMITLIRPTNIVFTLFLPLLGVYNWRTFLANLHGLFVAYYKHLILICVLAFVVISPQLMYWKYIFGSWVHYSYNNEGFFWLNPQFINGMFSYRNGWLIYSPLMALSLVGVFMLNGRLKQFRLPIILILPLLLYITFSWWCWWYAGSFGQRPLVDSYALLAIPLAAFVDKFRKLPYWAKYPGLLICVFFIGLNLFQTSQKQKGIIHFHGMTKRAYWTLFGMQTYPKNYMDLIDEPDYPLAKKGIYQIKEKKQK